MSRKDFGFLQRLLLGKVRLSNAYSTASSASLVDEHTFNSDSNAGTVITTDENREEKSLCISRSHSLFTLATRVLRSLSWEAVREIRFSEAVEKHGISHSVDVFSVIVHIFASARMETEVYCLLRQVVRYHKSSVNCDAFGLSTALVELSNDVETTSVVSQILIKVFAESRMVEQAVEAFLQAKKIGLKLSISSCNFMLKCAVERNKAEVVRCLFDEMKNSGPPTQCIHLHHLDEFLLSRRYGSSHRDSIRNGKE
ncbi:pentatricopeptide repeat-containing protein, mitochondrial-like protein [Cinnamomum micranthum f. kanehirae]|uniref:Pentatricopeptide repeat-containing protein, mitochondrial-like protein n=1 Tax=Cinnamomum micranthum f. kanehirae TaxID=337451 RepID=A0A443NLL1_9MAGN|nr:pentatricopeptide repeat-containing protein, mitochondrial-like protein [Cinnamomum micranthum f. kanehirae]